MEAKFICTGYPTPIILNGTTGEIIDPDAFGKTSGANFEAWLASVWNKKETFKKDLNLNKKMIWLNDMLSRNIKFERIDLTKRPFIFLIHVFF